MDKPKTNNSKPNIKGVLLAGMLSLGNQVDAQTNQECNISGDFKEGVNSAIIRDSKGNFLDNIIGYATRENISDIVFDFDDENEIEVSLSGKKVIGIGVELNGKKGYISKGLVKMIQECRDINIQNSSIIKDEGKKQREELKTNIETNDTNVGDFMKPKAYSHFVNIYLEVKNMSEWTLTQIKQVEGQMDKEIDRVIDAFGSGNGIDEIYDKYSTKNPGDIFSIIGLNYLNIAKNKLERDRKFILSILNERKSFYINKLASDLTSIDGYNESMENSTKEIESIISNLDTLLTSRSSFLHGLYQTNDFLIELGIRGNTTAKDSIDKDFAKYYKRIFNINYDRLVFNIDIEKRYQDLKQIVEKEEDATNYQLNKYGEELFKRQINTAIETIKNLEPKDLKILTQELYFIADEFINSGNFSKFIRDFNLKYDTNLDHRLKNGDHRDTFYSYHFRLLLEEYINIRQNDFYSKYALESQSNFKKSDINDILNTIELNPELLRAKNSINATINRAKRYDFIKKEDIDKIQKEMEKYLLIGASSKNPELYFYYIGNVLASKYQISNDFLITSDLNISNLFDNIATIIRINEMRNIFSNLSQNDYEKYKKVYSQASIFDILAINSNFSEFNINLNEKYDQVIQDVYKNHKHKDLIDDFFGGNYSELTAYIYRHLAIESRGKIWIGSGISDRNGEYAVGPIQQKMIFSRQFGGNPLSKKDSVKTLLDHMLFSFYKIPGQQAGKGEGQLVNYKDYPNRYDIGFATHIAWDTAVLRALKKAENSGNIENFYMFLPTDEMRTFIPRANKTVEYLVDRGLYIHPVDLEGDYSYNNNYTGLEEKIALLSEFGK